MADGDTKHALEAALTRVLDLRAALRADVALQERWLAVKAFQAARLQRTYPDLLISPRFSQAGRFFLDDLYGSKDFEQRDRQALRIVPKLVRLLPARAVDTITAAVELDELSETLDARVARWVDLPLDDARYAGGYRNAGTRPEREKQIDMVQRIGRSLDALARIPLIPGILHLMRGPAEAAGLASLHSFLQRGFAAFRSIGNAEPFLATIERRETIIMQRLFDGASEPFAPVDPSGAPPPR